MTATHDRLRPVKVSDIPRIERSEASGLAAQEVARFAAALEDLDNQEWSQPTANTMWDVRTMAGHVLGMTETFTSYRSLIRDMRAADRAKGDGPQIDGLTSHQVARTADLATTDLIGRLRAAGPRNARWRSHRRLLRHVSMKVDAPGHDSEKWRMGYLFDVILTRDTWMHRSDLALATDRPMELTEDHDGRIVADAVAEWGRRHGHPFQLELAGPAGGVFAHGDGGEQLTLDAVEFCRILSGRPAATEGLLSTRVPF